MNITSSLLATQRFGGSWFEFTTTADQSSFGIELRGYGGTVVIDWGDGSTELKSVKIQRQPNYCHRFDHTYSAAGTYTVRATTQHNSSFAPGNGARGGYGAKVGALDASFQQRGGSYYEGFENFANCSTYPMIDARGITSLDQAFSYIGAPQNFDTLIVPDWNTENCKSFVSTFYYNAGLKSFPNWNLSGAVTTSAMFSQCRKVEHVAGMTYDCRNVEDASLMFSACVEMEVPPTLTNFAPSNIDKMFEQCVKMLDWPVLDLSNTTSISGVFSYCTGFTDFPWYNIPSHITNVSGLCQGMNQFTTFPDIDISHCTIAQSLFSGLTVPFVVPNWDYSNLTSVMFLFRNSTGLTDSNVPSQSVLNIDWSKCSGTYMFEGTSITKTPAWTFGAGRYDNMFKDCYLLTTIDPNTNLKNTRFLSAMFRGCKELTSFPANFFAIPDGQKAELSEVFRHCTSLTDFGAGNFDTGDISNSITYSRYQFHNCALTPQSIENILVSCNRNPTDLTNMDVSAGSNAGYSTWTSAAIAAYNSLIGRGATILFNP